MGYNLLLHIYDMQALVVQWVEVRNMEGALPGG